MSRIKKKPVRIRKVGRMLTDPHPNFVSLVDHGANQTPFTVLKIEERKEVMPEKRTRKRAKVTDIHRMEFDAAVFKDEDAVKSYLEENGYEVDGEVRKDDGVFVVDGLPQDVFEDDSVRKLDTGKGLVIYAGRKAADKDDAQKSDKDAAAVDSAATKADDSPKDDGQDDAPGFMLEPVRKFNEWDVEISDGETVGDTLADGMRWDRFPPGFREVLYAYLKALHNALMNSENAAARTDAIRRVTAEFGDYVARLAALFGEITDMALAEKFAKHTFEDALALVDKNDDSDASAVDGDVVEGNSATKNDKPEDSAVKAVDDGTDVQDADVTDKTADGNGEDMAVVIAKSVAEAVQAAFAPLAEQMAEAVKEQKETVEKTVSTITERVGDMESVLKARKSMDAGSETPDDGKAQKAETDPLTLNMMGMRR